MVLEVLLESLSSQNIRRPDSWPTKHQMRERSLAEACSERFLVCATRLRSQRALLQVARRRQLRYSSGVRFVCVNTRGSAKRNSARAGERTRSRSGIGEAESEREKERRAQRRMQSKKTQRPTHTQRNCRTRPMGSMCCMLHVRAPCAGSLALSPSLRAAFCSSLVLSRFWFSVCWRGRLFLRVRVRSRRGVKTTRGCDLALLRHGMRLLGLSRALLRRDCVPDPGSSFERGCALVCWFACLLRACLCETVLFALATRWRSTSACLLLWVVVA